MEAGGSDGWEVGRCVADEVKGRGISTVIGWIFSRVGVRDIRHHVGLESYIDMYRLLPKNHLPRPVRPQLGLVEGKNNLRLNQTIHYGRGPPPLTTATRQKLLTLSSHSPWDQPPIHRPDLVTHIAVLDQQRHHVRHLLWLPQPSNRELRH